MSTLFELYGGISLEVRGKGETADKLRKTFDHFASTDSSLDPDIVCEISRTQPDPETVLGAPDYNWGREGDRFVIQNRDGFISIDSEWEHFLVSPDIFHYKVAYLIEFEVRKRLASEGRALIHASAVQLDGTTYLFPAWRYTGKTSTGLTFLRAGADYLTDDRLWVGTDGVAFGYPVPLNMRISNIRTYPGVVDITQAEQRRLQASEHIYDRVDIDRSVVDKAVYFLTSHYLDPGLDRQLVSIDQLIPGSRYIEKAEIDNVVVLRTWAKSPGNSVAVEEVSTRDALADLMGINHYEWDRDLKDHYEAYEMLFPENDDKSDELDALIAAEERNLSELLDDVSTYRALVPRETDWKSTGIADTILEEFTELAPSTELRQ